MVAQVDMACLLTQPHQNYDKGVEQPSLKTGRKQVNRGMITTKRNHIKETISIQTGRRGGDAEQAGPTSMCGG